MKISPAWLMVPVALALGYTMGSHGPLQQDPAADAALPRKLRESSQSRPTRADPFGGPSFSLRSMDDVRELFKHQRASVAAARLTLSVDSLPASELAGMMEMVRDDMRENPRDYQTQYEMVGALFDRWAQVDPDAAIEYLKNCKSRSFQNEAGARLFGALAKSDPARAMAELKSLPNGRLRQSAGSQIVSALADTDPAAACDILEQESAPGGFGRYTAGQVFAEWAKTDPAAAAARLAKMPLDRVDEYAASGLAGAWAKKDPEAALAWAKSQRGDWKSDASSAVYHTLALEDSAGAWERLKGEPGYLRSRLLASVLGVVSDEDPEGAFALLKGLESKAEKRIAAGNFIEQISWSDPRLAMQALDSLDDPATRRQQLGNLLYYATWSNPELVDEQVAKMSDRDKIQTAGAVLRGLMTTDPAKAESYFTDLPESQRGGYTLPQLMSQYADKQPQKAFDFALSLENPQERTKALSSVFGQWSRADPEAAADAWKRLPAGQNRLEALGGIAANWSMSDPQGAQAWANGLSGDERTRALTSVLPALAQDNPTSAASQLGSLIATAPDGMGKDLSASAGNLAARWANEDPKSAANWVASLSDGSARDAGLKSVSAAWSRYDAVAAAGWLSTLPAGSSRDAAVEPLVEQVRQNDPATAFSWAASIGDDNQRLNQLRATLQSWRTSDMQGARAALNAADLSEKDHASLAKELK